MDRRGFLKELTWLSAVTAVPAFVARSISAIAKESAGCADARERVLVLVELTGGCDGLNALVPYGRDAYYRARPSLALPKAKLLPVTNALGFHPALSGVKRLFDDGKVAIVQGVGYPNPNRSHLESLQVWRKGLPPVGERGDEGAAREENKECSEPSHWDYVRKAALPGPPLPPAAVVAPRAAPYPSTSFGQQLRAVADALASGEEELRFVYTRLGGFDTHVEQVATGRPWAGAHAVALQALAEGIGSFYRDLRKMGRADQVLLVTFSEFGRRLRENATRGSDHGTANVMFLVGGPVKPGLYGTYPALDEPALDPLGDPVPTVDFRAVYATILERWLDYDGSATLGGGWPRLGFL